VRTVGFKNFIGLVEDEWSRNTRAWDEFQMRNPMIVELDKGIENS
jgi:hypothetical protein